MPITANRLHRPVEAGALKPGQLFEIIADKERWLCMRAVSEAGQALHLVLDGPAERPNGWPGVISEFAVQGTVALLPALEVVVEPVPREMLARPRSEGVHTDLCIDGNGEPWVQVAEGGYRYTVCLSDGKMGTPGAPRIYFDSWRICLRDGRELIEVHRFGKV